MTCSTLSAIIASAAPNRYGRQSGWRRAANFRGAGADATGDGWPASATGTWVAIPQAAHTSVTSGKQLGPTLPPCPLGLRSSLRRSLTGVMSLCLVPGQVQRHVPAAGLGHIGV